MMPYKDRRKARKKMPHSLRARLGNLRYKKIISDKDYVRLCKALDNEKILDNIRAEIDKWHHLTDKAFNDGIDTALEIIDKYRGENE